jgi:hypothetical protein
MLQDMLQCGREADVMMTVRILKGRKVTQVLQSGGLTSFMKCLIRIYRL